MRGRHQQSKLVYFITHRCIWINVGVRTRYDVSVLTSPFQRPQLDKHTMHISIVNVNFEIMFESPFQTYSKALNIIYLYDIINT